MDVTVSVGCEPPVCATATRHQQIANIVSVFIVFSPFFCCDGVGTLCPYLTITGEHNNTRFMYLSILCEANHLHFDLAFLDNISRGILVVVIFLFMANNPPCWQMRGDFMIFYTKEQSKRSASGEAKVLFGVSLRQPFEKDFFRVIESRDGVCSELTIPHSEVLSIVDYNNGMPIWRNSQIPLSD